MNVDKEYDGSVVKLDIPKKNLLGVISPPSADMPLTGRDLLERMDEVGPGPTLGEFIQRASGGKLLIVINDSQRPTRTSIVLDAILPLLTSIEQNITISIATGTHGPPSEDETKELMGGAYDVFKDRVHVHRAREKETHRYYGTTSRGTRILFDRILDDADSILVIGSIEPHYFAGFTGGRKAFLPGHAAYETIEHNHSFALKTGAALLNLKDNPVHQDMIESCGFLDGKNIYSVQLVLDCCGNVARAFGGDIHDSLESGIPACKQFSTVEISELADIVVTVAEYPMDISLYQSHKALENAKLALKDGGILVLISATRQGIGDNNFSDLLSSSEDLDEILDVIERKYVWGYHKTAKIIDALKRFNVMIVSSLEDNVVRSLHMDPVPSPQDAIDVALERKGEHAKILVMPKGSALVPILSKRT